MNPFTRSALATLLWSSVDHAGDPLDSGELQPSPELIDGLIRDCEAFLAAAAAILPDDPDDALASLNGWEDQAGRDFILTRNHHGAGFWDDGWHEPYGRQLTELAERFKEIDAYVGDDGLIYC